MLGKEARYFEAGGFLDKSLFLYFEEICVAEICRSLGLQVIYEPSLRVLHREHRSTGEGVSRFSYECHKKALRYIRSRYLSGSRGFAGSWPDLVP
jgi:GT2 family glycosyltransferase